MSNNYNGGRRFFRGNTQSGQRRPREEDDSTDRIARAVAAALRAVGPTSRPVAFPQRATGMNRDAAAPAAPPVRTGAFYFNDPNNVPAITSIDDGAFYDWMRKNLPAGDMDAIDAMSRTLFAGVMRMVYNWYKFGGANEEYATALRLLREDCDGHLSSSNQ